MGVFRRIWNMTLDSLNIPHEAETEPRSWYGVPPPVEDDLIHKYCTGQVDEEGREISRPALSSEKYTRGQIETTPEELTSLLSQYGSLEEKPPEEILIKSDGSCRIPHGESAPVSTRAQHAATICW